MKLMLALILFLQVAGTVMILAVIQDGKEKLNNQLRRIMATLDDVIKDVTDESSLVDGLSTLIAGLQQQIKDLLAGVTVPPDVQAKIDQVFAQAEANKQKMAAALAANTTT